MDCEAAGLSTLGRSPESFVSRQVRVWTKQIRAVTERAEQGKLPAELKDVPPSLAYLIDALPGAIPEAPGPVCLVHGDYRLDNAILRGEEDQVAAVLDWELAALGHPLVDLAHFMLPYHLPRLRGSPVSGFGHAEDAAAMLAGGMPSRGGAGGAAALAAAHIPRPDALVASYVGAVGGSSGGSELQPCLARVTSRLAHDGLPGGWDLYVSVAFFRAAAILHGVYARSCAGNASADNAKAVGGLAALMAERGEAHLRKYEKEEAGTGRGAEGRGDVTPPPVAAAGKAGGESGTADAGGGAQAAAPKARAAARGAARRGGESTHIAGMSPDALRLYRRVREFVHERVLPAEAGIEEEVEGRTGAERFSLGDPAAQSALRAEAKADGLWNLFMPAHADPQRRWGHGLSTREYAPMAEEMGRSLVAPYVFNCNAPDTGNMEILAMFGTASQQERWLRPLAEGDARSCFGMTEPAVASSDATNMRASVLHGAEGGTVEARGRKWWTTGALDPACRLMIFMGRDCDAAGSPTEAPRHRQHSMVLVPMDAPGPGGAPGVAVRRPLTVFGYDDAPYGHAEVDVDVSGLCARESLILGPGEGFRIAQGRLGPGRVHHCMRLVGMAERAIEAAAARAWDRSAFGGLLAAKGSVRMSIGQMRAEVEAARMLTLSAAAAMDEEGNTAARGQVALIKAVVPSAVGRVLDQAMQIHGGAGLSDDFPLARMYAAARSLRLADGPDEVHWTAVGRSELEQWRPDDRA